MIIAILSDAHGNRLFFDKCIHRLDESSPGKLFFLGDAYGYFDDGDYIIDELIKRNAIILKGNHEAMLVGEHEIDQDKDILYRLEKRRKTISSDRKKYLKKLSPVYSCTIDELRLLFVHGSPENPLYGYLYEDNKNYDWNDDYDYIFMGHTHRSFCKKIVKANQSVTTYVNVGSCGLPRDKGCEPSFCLFDTVTGEIRLIRERIDDRIIDDDYYVDIAETVKDVLRR